MQIVNPPSVFTRQYASSNQAITSSGLLTLAHGFGVIPKSVEVDLVCLTAEGNWSVSDIIKSVTNYKDGTVAFENSMAIYADATNVYIRYSNRASCFLISNKTTGVGFASTNANWNTRVRAYV